ncbi:glutathione S-transferase N-terminal domain-containing protein [Oceanomicrobium pacificus]|uniref:Glutathione S-transferase n=1 Tax=Oceanomicrobium pacificus TaxID=2692916 RepID=A0A6B0TRG1_9RHOB|nr:glutathione S-transferase N-terminal domain-containing protein [Oceanomicrobium pacificus]MXU65289.1 glutathione S-transferase [Oceanomicrobium pacificus]
MTLPILYSFRRCPYAMRARLALSACGARVALREVRLRDKPAAMLDASPKGTVPVLVLPDGTVIEESRDVVDWALARSGDTAFRATWDEALTDRIDTEFKPHLDTYKYRFHDAPDRSQAARAAAAPYLAELANRLETRDWLSGTAPGITDLMILPFVRQFAMVDRPWFDASAPAALVSWLDRGLAAPWFLAVMDKYDPWRPGAPEPIFPEAA